MHARQSKTGLGVLFTQEADSALKTALLTDGSIILTVLTVLGMLLAVIGLWPLQGDAADLSSLVGISLVYLAGGLPAAWRAAVTLWEEHVLDIDLLIDRKSVV